MKNISDKLLLPLIFLKKINNKRAALGLTIDNMPWWIQVPFFVIYIPLLMILASIGAGVMVWLGLALGWLSFALYIIRFPFNTRENLNYFLEWIPKRRNSYQDMWKEWLFFLMFFGIVIGLIVWGLIKNPDGTIIVFIVMIFPFIGILRIDKEIGFY